MITIRDYTSSDYQAVKRLYQDSTTYGGQYDEARDTSEKLAVLTKTDPCKIIVAVYEDRVVGTLTLFEDGRTAFLYRFAVSQGVRYEQAYHALYNEGTHRLKRLGHEQVLLLTPVGDDTLHHRYQSLGMIKGGDYTCYRDTL